MTDGVGRACAYAMTVRRHAEDWSTQPRAPPEQNGLVQNNDVVARARTFVLQVEERWSRDGPPSPDWLASIYAAEIDYYGKRRPRQLVVAEKQAFAAKWPRRSYRLQPGSMTARCDAASCVVKGS